MPITIKSSRMQYRKSNGDYVGVDAVSERKTAEYVSDIESTGTTTQSAIEQTASTARDAIDTKAQQARDSIPSDYTALSDEVGDLKSAINDIVTKGSVETFEAGSPTRGTYIFFKGRKYRISNNSTVPFNFSVAKEAGQYTTIKVNIRPSSSFEWVCNDDGYVLYSMYFGGSATGTGTIEAVDNGIFQSVYDIEEALTPVQNLNSDVINLKYAAGVFQNIADPANFIAGSVWISSNNTYSNADFYRTEIPVIAGHKYTLSETNGAFSWFTNENGENLGKISANGIYTAPEGCTLLRLSTVSTQTIVVLDTDYDGTITPELFPYGSWFSKVDADAIIASMKTVVPTYDNTTLSMFPSIAIIGDSFESGGIYITEGTLWGAFYDYSWPTVLERRCGSVVNNYSSPGLSTRTWLTHETRGLPKALADAGSALYMIFLGINDYGMENYLGTIADITADYTQNPDTFYGNYARIIEQMQAHSPGAKFMLVVPPLITPEYATAIENIASHYNLPVFRSGSDPFFATDFYINNKGTAHPVAMTYAGMALAYERLGSLCIQDNQQYFFDVH